MTTEEEYLKAKQIVEEYESKAKQVADDFNDNIIPFYDVIKKLNIRFMRCRSGQGLMSYSYSFLQIGGYAGQSYDEVRSEDIWNGDYSTVGTILDCRNGKCEKINKDKLREIIKQEML